MIEPKYKNIYDKFLEQYKNIHVNPWHEITEEELNNIYNSLVNTMDINDEYRFKYFIDYIIKRLSGKTDAHTKYDLVSLIPINFKIFANEVIVNYPKSLKNSKLVAINGININIIIKELEEIITYGTIGKRKYELERSLFNKYTLFSLPSLRDSNSLVFEIIQTDGTKIRKVFGKEEKYSNEELFDYNQYRYGENGTYEFMDNFLIYHHTTIQSRFKEQIELAVSKLREEDLSSIDTIIIDIRGNTGGNSALNKILMDFLQEHTDKKLLCLTDYRVFSGGRYALRDLINLGATTIGEEISTPINCYGNCNWFNIDNHYFCVSECYFHPFLGWSASSKEEFNQEVTDELLFPCIFKPDILVEERLEDYIENIDTILEYAKEYSKKVKRI